MGSLHDALLASFHRRQEENREQGPSVGSSSNPTPKPQSVHVDDYLKSVESHEKVISSVDQLRNLLARGGFNLTKWVDPSTASREWSAGPGFGQ